MKKLITACLFLAVPIVAHAQTAEGDLALSIQAVQTSAAQLQRAAQAFAIELSGLKKEQAKAVYWQDACMSTPGCGEPIDKPVRVEK